MHIKPPGSSPAIACKSAHSALYVLHCAPCRTLTIPIADIVTPGYSQVVPGEGLPKPTGGRGNLILEVELLFPHTLNETQKMLIRSAFFLPAHPSKEQVKALRSFEAAFKEPLTGWAHCLPREDDVKPAAHAKS